MALSTQAREALKTLVMIAHPMVGGLRSEEDLQKILTQEQLSDPAVEKALGLLENGQVTPAFFEYVQELDVFAPPDEQ
jgi:hypothetical protein